MTATITEPSTRQDFLTAHTTTTKADVAVALQIAETAEDVDSAAHLSLLLFGVGGCSQPFVEHGATWSSLHEQVIAARRRTGGYQAGETKTRERMSAARHAATQTRKSELHAARAARERRIQSLGITNARP